ncbi:hypothetical protein FRB99_008131 [Tulasnella sp. 403]|nr:hypothetical protein FRB99_008131 [Tulasnella sp. 403]
MDTTTNLVDPPDTDPKRDGKGKLQQTSQPQTSNRHSRLPPNTGSSSLSNLSKKFVASALCTLVVLQFFSPSGLSVTSLFKGHHVYPTSVLPSYNLPDSIARNLGPYTPRYAVQSFDSEDPIPTGLPLGCEVTQVHLLARHAARFPTTGALKSIQRAYNKLQRAIERDPGVIKDTPLAFLADWRVDLGTDSLVDFGREQAYGTGKEIASKYAHLAGGGVFVRSTSKDRVLESSRWFKHAFYGGSYPFAVDSLPSPDVKIKTGSKYNNTLSSDNCAAEEESEQEDVAKRWLSVYAPPITARLNSYVPGLNLGNDDIAALMSACAFETVYHDKGRTPSPWCYVFTETEWEANEYYEDLRKYYESSYGSPFGRAQGSGWVSELIARLTGEPVHVSGSVNRTLDSDPRTFPLPPNAPFIFADFSSDNNIAHIIAAMGILKDADALPSSGPPPVDRLFVSSKLVPFNTNFVVEKMSCSDVRYARNSVSIDNSERDAVDYVRIVLNGAVVPLRFEECGDLGIVEGMCRLDEFVRSQAFSLGGGGGKRRDECVKGRALLDPAYAPRAWGGRYTPPAEARAGGDEDYRTGEAGSLSVATQTVGA